MKKEDFQISCDTCNNKVDDDIYMLSRCPDCIVEERELAFKNGYWQAVRDMMSLNIAISSFNSENVQSSMRNVIDLLRIESSVAV